MVKNFVVKTLSYGLREIFRSSQHHSRELLRCTKVFLYICNGNDNLYATAIFLAIRDSKII